MAAPRPRPVIRVTPKPDVGPPKVVVIVAAAADGHHVPGTPYEWRHEWHPLNAEVAKQYGKKFAGGDGGKERRPANAQDHLTLRNGSAEDRARVWSEVQDSDLRKVFTDATDAYVPSFADSKNERKSKKQKSELLGQEFIAERDRRGGVKTTPPKASSSEDKMETATDDGQTMLVHKGSSDWSVLTRKQDSPVLDRPRGARKDSNVFATHDEASAALPGLLKQHNSLVAKDRARQAALQDEEDRHNAEVARTRYGATDSQVDAIMREVDKRRRDYGDPRSGPGFTTGPVTREQISKMSRRDASVYLTSLREEY